MHFVRRAWEWSNSMKLHERRRNEKDQDHRTSFQDGVIQAPGGPKEDGDYPYGGWVVSHRDPVVGEAISAAHGEVLDLLLGRRTYDIWSDYWPKAKSGPIASSLNAATKYVATRRREDYIMKEASRNGLAGV
jgi:dihydrofolate reductase